MLQFLNVDILATVLAQLPLPCRSRCVSCSKMFYIMRDRLPVLWLRGSQLQYSLSAAEPVRHVTVQSCGRLRVCDAVINIESLRLCAPHVLKALTYLYLRSTLHPIVKIIAVCHMLAQPAVRVCANWQCKAVQELRNLPDWHLLSPTQIEIMRTVVAQQSITGITPFQALRRHLFYLSTRGPELLSKQATHMIVCTQLISHAAQIGGMQTLSDTDSVT